MDNPRPSEVIAAPVTLYWAPVGTPFPLVNVDLPDPWVRIGKNGANSYFEDGVTITQSENIEKFRGLASTLPIKSFRTEEDLTVTVRLADFTAEALQLALNRNSIATVAAAVGVAGTRTIGLARGPQVKQLALIVRWNVSPYGEVDLNVQYKLPRMALTGNTEINAQKGIPIGLEVVFDAMADLDAEDEEFLAGSIEYQETVPL